MNKIPIQCPVLRRMLLAHIIEQIDGGHMDSLLRAGYSPEFLDDLRYRTTRDITNLANSPQEMWFSLSEQVISKGLHLLDMRREHAKLREYFVIHGASRRMVCAYFKLSHEEYRDLRAQLRPGGEPGGRTALHPDAERDAIHRAWFDIQKSISDKPCRDRIYALHQQFPELRISVLQQTIVEFAEDDELGLEIKPTTPPLQG